MKLINSGGEFQNILKNNKYVLVDWSATWCGPCKEIAPYLELIEDEYDDVLFIKVVIDKLQNLSQEFHISTVPTFHLIKNGVTIKKVVGGSIEQVIKMLSTR